MYKLDFDIDPALYKRAVTQPILPARKAAMRWRDVRNFVAVLCFFGATWMLGQAAFPMSNMFAVPLGAVFGAGLILAVWWKQHRGLVRHHATYNETAGRQSMEISAAQIRARRPGVTSEVEWSFVQDIWQIEGATLIDLGTARLIVPDDALPDGVGRDAFLADLQAWKAAA